MQFEQIFCPKKPHKPNLLINFSLIIEKYRKRENTLEINSFWLHECKNTVSVKILFFLFFLLYVFPLKIQSRYSTKNLFSIRTENNAFVIARYPSRVRTLYVKYIYTTIASY